MNTQKRCSEWVRLGIGMGMLLALIWAPLAAHSEGINNDPLDPAIRKALRLVDKHTRSTQNRKVVVDRNNCVEFQRDISLPFSLLVAERLTSKLREAGHALHDGSVRNQNAVVLGCRWSLKDDTIHLTFNVTPWTGNKRGTVSLAAEAISVSALPPHLFEPDLDAWARTLVHRLDSANRLQPNNVYLRPFELEGQLQSKEVQEYFDHWFLKALKNSSLFDALQASEVLAQLGTNNLRSRGIRPKEKPGRSLTGDLLNAEMELTGTIRYQDPAKAPNKTRAFAQPDRRGIRPVLTRAVGIHVALSQPDGDQLSKAAVAIPVEVLPPSIATMLTTPVTTVDVSQPVGRPNPMGLEITTTRGEGTPTYQAGEKIQFVIRLDRAAYLYLFDFDNHGDVSLLYPLPSTPIRQLPANQPLILPDDALPYELEVTPPFGVDVVWAIAIEKPLSIPDQLTGPWSKSVTLPDLVRGLAKKQRLSHSEARVEVHTVPKHLKAAPTSPVL
jgi:hypothetical protein